VPGKRGRGKTSQAQSLRPEGQSNTVPGGGASGRQGPPLEDRTAAGQGQRTAQQSTLLAPPSVAWVPVTLSPWSRRSWGRRRPTVSLGKQAVGRGPRASAIRPGTLRHPCCMSPGFPWKSRVGATICSIMPVMMRPCHPCSRWAWFPCHPRGRESGDAPKGGWERWKGPDPSPLGLQAGPASPAKR